MAYSLIERVPSTVGSASPRTATLSATPSDGELLVAVLHFLFRVPTYTIVPPTDFSLLASSYDNTSNVGVAVYTKVAASEAGAAYDFASSNTTAQKQIVMYRFSGAGAPTSLGTNTSDASPVTSIDAANGSVAVDANAYVLAALSISGESTGGFTWNDSFTKDSQEYERFGTAYREFSGSGSAQPAPSWTSANLARSVLVQIPSEVASTYPQNRGLLLGIG